MDISNTPELLERHGGFVRSLARALLRDPAQAEDVAQEALTRWVTQPPHDTSRPRGWFATVVRRLAANAQRADERRARHEEQAARPEPSPTPLEQNEQAELVQRVVAAVMALEPAQRDTILSRYFRGLTVSELAAESGTGEDTLRTRERRALERLREKLDKHFGARAAWALGLGKLAERSPAPAPAPVTSASSPATWIGAASGLALATTAAVLWFTVLRDESGVPSAAAPSSGVVAEVRVGSPDQPPSIKSAPLAARQPAVTSNASPARASSDASSRSSSALTAELAEIRGAFVLENGAPAAHVAWRLQGVPSADDGDEPLALWVGPQGECAEDGTFQARFAPPSGFEFWFTAERAGCARSEWGWSAIEPGRVLDLGRATLMRAATVTGRLVDAAGAPILDQEWTLDVVSMDLGVEEGRKDVRVEAEFDPVTASFRVEGVMPGDNELTASHRVGGKAERRLVVGAGETLAVDLVYDGPDNAKRIVVQPVSHPPYESLDPSGTFLHLVWPDGTSRSEADQHGLFARHSFEELAPGAYTAMIDDPHFRPWSQSGIAPGTRVKAVLQGCSALACRAQDAEGSALVFDSLTVQSRGSTLARELVRAGEAFDGRVELAPGDYTLRARSGAFEGEVEVALGFDETRALALTLVAPGMLSGRVLDANGAAVSGAQILLLRPASQYDSLASPILPPNSSTGDPQLFRKQLDATDSAADGSFALRVGRGGACLVYAELANGLCVDTSVLSLAEGEGLAGIELTLPPAASVSGRVRGPAGASLAGLRLWLGPEMESRAGLRRFLTMDERAQKLPADGSFAFEGLPAGTMRAFLMLPLDAYPEDVGRAGSWNRIELGRFELAAGEALVRDFAGTLPGSYTIEVRVNGEPAPGVHLYIAQPFDTPRRPQFNVNADGRGVFGPRLLFPGPWSVTAASALEPTPLDICPGGETHLVVEVQEVEGSVRLLDAGGAALARRSVSVFFQGADGPPQSRARLAADEQGRVRFTLAPGAYRLRLDDGSSHPSPFLKPDDVTVPLTWTAQGPLESEIRF